MEKKTSQKKIESNRRNGQKSTGPKTAKGKRAVRFNAVKHGILSKEALIKEGEGQESADEFNILFAELSEELQPKGALERMYTERIVICVWRLKRALRAEVGEIRKEQDAVLFRGLIHDWDPAKADGGLEPAKESDQFDRVYTYLRHIIGRSEKYKDETGKLTDEFKTNSNAIIERMKDLNFPSDQIRDFENKATKLVEGKETDKKKIRELIRELYGERIKEFETWVEHINHNMALEISATSLSRSLPRKEAVDKILRYETAIERQLYRAINELERLQGRRQGEVAPPTINVEVSKE